MKKIVVPTDFSKTAMNAIQYGVKLAQSLECDLELVHVLNPATDFNTGYMIDPGIETVRRKKLKELEERFQSTSDFPVTSRFILGFPIEALIDLSEEPDVMLVVGATGASDVLEVVFGNVATHIAQNSKSPALIVPENARYVPFKEIVYASSDPRLDDRISTLVKDFVSRFKSRLHSVHIGSGEDYPDWKMKAIFDSRKIPELLTIQIDNKNVVEALNNYCLDESADLLILATRERDFWRTLVHKSVTRKFALKPDLPLLVLHAVEMNQKEVGSAKDFVETQRK